MNTKNSKEFTFDEMRKIQREHDKLEGKKELTLDEINKYIREVRNNDSPKPKQK